ncbi:hypothetical protein DOTSEDRAFT_70324 [Dothistroma septosporum NZE10]|uniref:Uncharacterized protein n=1 Tax=Dothistroma septosporum (strain NZE10 / CBS 128990) TaxID=675120 RepID=N1PTJ6_DOTSN|nr:hypothetical protein DOTSEDRAFT_70324 [Dothistroma septosporum NZE10]
MTPCLATRMADQFWDAARRLCDFQLDMGMCRKSVWLGGERVMPLRNVPNLSHSEALPTKAFAGLPRLRKSMGWYYASFISERSAVGRRSSRLCRSGCASRHVEGVVGTVLQWHKQLRPLRKPCHRG